MKLKRIFVVLATAAVMVVAVAPFRLWRRMQNKAANRAANKAARQAEKQAQRAAAAGGASVAPANEGTQKALPSSGGMPAGPVALLGAGVLLVGSGVLLYRKSANS